jgi:hypothetical protein
MDGTWARLEPLDAAAHADQLFDAFAADTAGRMWTYMFSGPFDDRAAFHAWVESRSQSRDPLFFTIVDRRLGRATGTGVVPEDRTGARRDRGRSHRVCAGVAAHRGSHRRDVPDDEDRIRPWLPSLRVEVRRAERRVATRRTAARLQLRGHLSPGDRLQGPQPRHRRGTRSSIANGRCSTPSSGAGSSRRISTRQGRQRSTLAIAALAAAARM